MQFNTVPYLGIATVVGVTAMDVKDGCDTIKDVNEMMALFGEEAVADESEVCGMSVPSPGELASKAKMKFSGLWGAGESNVPESEVRHYNEAVNMVEVEAGY